MAPKASPKLEILTAAPQGPAVGAPLVFVHGAFCGAWIWAENFLPFFAQKGRAAHAVSLRGHGTSEGRESLDLATLDDYLDDLARVVDGLDQRPVLVGHSMGGMVVQRFIERHDRAAFADAPAVRGMALLAALPPGGLAASATHLMLFEPGVFWQLSALQMFGENAIHAASAHRAMFSDNAPVELTERYLPLMQHESKRVQMDLMMGAPPWPGNALTIPRLILGVRDDPFVPPWMVRSTARHYGTEAHILDDSGHAMMLGPDWRRPAGMILDWLDDNGL